MVLKSYLRHRLVSYLPVVFKSSTCSSDPHPDLTMIKPHVWHLCKRPSSCDVFGLPMTTCELSPLIGSLENENDINQDGAGQQRKVMREENNKRYDCLTVCIYLSCVTISTRISSLLPGNCRRSAERPHRRI